MGMMSAKAIAQPLELSELMHGLVEVTSPMDCEIHGIALDSRALVRGDLFLACAGHHQHGLAFAEQAVAQGAAAIVWEQDKDQSASFAAGLSSLSIPVIPLPGLSQWVSHISGRFYGHPSRKITLYGITGTNGKTSVCQLLAQALSAELACGVIGTLGAGFPDRLKATGMTTPDGATLQRLLAELYQQGAGAIAMEVSSHALDQSRVADLFFDTAIFTNLSRDHFDYHGSLENYGDAKGQLFQMPDLQCAVINLDDPFGQTLIRGLKEGVKVIGYGLNIDAVTTGGIADWVCATHVALLPQGLRIHVVTPNEEAELNSPLLGAFNASNLLAVLAVLLHRGWSLKKAIAQLSNLSTVPGRMALFGGGDNPAVVVDYAHTPDALEKALMAAREHCPGRLFVVFGCGGDRDRGKRPIMGELAARLADVCYLTDDNPRSESSAHIIEQIRAGIPETQQVEIISNRRDAIDHAVNAAVSGDLVLVAGKGHETYQLMGDQVLYFDDREVVREALTKVREHTDE
jgi:UDP-N-acetylmuramoyl-L-alanyl-D-glutamate--2,6-diaminopimelate ligase